MTSRTDDPLDVRAVESLLRSRFAAPRETSSPPCAGLETVARAVHGGADRRTLSAAAAHLDECRDCREALAALHEDEGTVPATLPLHGGRTWRVGPFLLAASVLLTLGLAGMLGLRLLKGRDEQDNAPGGALAIKGAADTISIAVERGAKRFRARPGDALLDGDRIGFFYSAEQPGYLALFELNEQGEVTVLFPTSGAKSAPITAGRRVALPDGGIVKETQLCEWLVGVFSDQALGLVQLETTLGTAARASSGCVLSPTIVEARTAWIFKVR